MLRLDAQSDPDSLYKRRCESNAQDAATVLLKLNQKSLFEGF